MNCRLGSGRIAPRVQIPADVVPGTSSSPVQAELADQASAFRAPRQQRLRARIHRDTRHLGDPELAAEPRRALQHGHRQPGAPEQERGCQAGDTAADDRH